MPNENDKIYLEYCELLMQAKECGLGYRVEFKDTLYLVPTPLVLLDDKNRFHSDSMPAIRWKGGREVYFLHGVKFDEDLFKKVTSREMPFEDILKIEDIDQRTQAMRFGDVDKFLEYAKAEKLDERIKFKPSGEKVHYALYEIPKGDIFSTDAYYMRYECPSTDRVYMSGVEPCKTVAEAMAWKIKTNKESWNKLIPLITES